MDILNQIRITAATDYNEYLKNEKNSGKKIIGYFCSYVPEEIIHAAGMIPYRMRAVNNKGTSKGDIYFSSLNCTFVRHCFDKALRDDFDFLDGLIITNSCDHIRRIFDNWRHAKIKPDFLHMFVIPHVSKKPAIERFKSEIDLLITKIEKEFNVTITDEKLNNSISLYNKKRQLIKKIYERRKDRRPFIKGSEMLSVMLAVTAMPVEKSILILQNILDLANHREIDTTDKIRVFISSGCTEEIKHLELIEECGSVIISDNMCYGSKYFDKPVSEHDFPVYSIAERYLTHMSCPRMMDLYRTRLEHIKQIKNDYHIDAFIAEKLKFCDLWGGEIYIYKQDSKQSKLPLLTLEREMYSENEGQVKTKIQAFFEQLRNSKTVKIQT